VAGGGPNFKKGFLLSPVSSGPPPKSGRSEGSENPGPAFFKTLIPFIWSAGLALFLARLAAGIGGAFRLTRTGTPVRDPRWQVLLARFLAAIHLQRRVRLKSHHAVPVPLTCGFIRPVVLIPDGHESWTDEQRASTLLHELSHIKRADFLVMVLVRLSLAAFWFNPLSWVVFRKLKNEQEAACDERVLRTGIKPSTYAANLLFFKNAAGARLSHFAALLGLFGLGRSAFNERLAAILKQRWTFQEVRMKTKITLFCAVVLAVALIGLARPPEQAQAQDKQARGEKEQEAETKKPVAVVIKEGGKHRHQILIGEGDRVKTIVVDKPVIIKEGQEGKVFIITPDGLKAVAKTVEGEPVHLEFIGDHLEVLEEGKILRVGKEDGVVYIVVDPKVHISETVAADVDKAVELALEDVPAAVEAAESAAAVSAEVAEAVKIALKHLPVTVTVGETGSPHVTWIAEDQEKEIQEKLRAIREKLKAVEENKLELRAVDEALAELEKELEKLSRETSWVAREHMKKPEVITVVKKKGGQETVVEVKPDVGVEVEPRVGVEISESPSKHPIKVIIKEKGVFSLISEVSAGEKGRAAYDRIVARVKRDLPEGYALEPSFEVDSGLVTLKVKGPFEKGVPHDLVKKLADGIREELEENTE
jgi:beta-lactamase regulating signal transducer with metallopeptidase domain